VDCCSRCGEPLSDDGLCAVCLLAGGLENSDALPDRIGRYRILRLIGEGGMGIVYEAEQEQPRRTVALKVIKSGPVSPEVLRRFTQESQALGRLHHPGIAQVYEAGTADNGFGPQPFFAMELIRGQSLESYAEANGLKARQRLQLMLQICEAAQHAHERGIIHRDLKPGNILVNESGHPKILDFGVARMTDSDIKATRQTEVGQFVGTLAYMSPEQVLADSPELDARSDVYTLGVILYELLAGRLPYTISRHVHQAVQTIRDEDPTLLSSVNRLYRGDIETIVHKALEKEKSRRYASAADLAADIRKYLEDQPIAARPPSASYQLHKFARRHRGLVASVAAAFMALVAGIIASTIEASQAGLAEHLATNQRDRAMVAEAQAEPARLEAEAAKTQALAAEGKARTERDRALRERQRADTEAATAMAVNEFLRRDVLAQASPENSQ
jgi:eukaryotic-like serine/threonine-protein kinase